MLLIAAIIGSLAFWLYAERKWDFRIRILGSLIFWGGCLLYLHYSHRVITDYERQYVAAALKILDQNGDAKRSPDQLRLLDRYKTGDLSGAELLTETRRIRNFTESSTRGQAGTSDPGQP